MLKKIVLIPIFLILLSFPRTSFSDDLLQEHWRDFDNLMTQDPEVGKLRNWDRVASRVRGYVLDNPNSNDLPEVYYLLGILHEQIFKKRNLSSRLDRAAVLFTKVHTEYPNSSYADDALIRLADLKREFLDNEQGAREDYFTIVDEYSDSNSYTKARIRLGLSKEAASKRPKKVIKPRKIEKISPPAEPNPPPVSKPLTVVEKEKEETKDEIIPAPTPLEVEEVNEDDKIVDRKGIFSFLFGEDEKEDKKKDKKFSDYTVVIDPGHGGEDLGAKGLSGYSEKDIVLSISLLLKEMIEEDLGAKVVLTRVEDVSLSLKERTEIANNEKADLFISIHANASPNKRASGIETYFLDNTNDRSSLKLAKRENEVHGGMDSDLQFIISDLIQSAKLDDSITLAHVLQEALVEEMKGAYEDVKDLGVKKAPFYVLVGAHMPCALVEVSFIDHEVEGRRLISAEYQLKLAESLFNGVRDYLSAL